MAPGYCCRSRPLSRTVATPTSRTSHIPLPLALYYCNWCSYKWPSPSDNISFVAFIASLRQLAAAAAVGVAEGKSGWRGGEVSKFVGHAAVRRPARNTYTLYFRWPPLSLTVSLWQLALSAFPFPMPPSPISPLPAGYNNSPSWQPLSLFIFVDFGFV